MNMFNNIPEYSPAKFKSVVYYILAMLDRRTVRRQPAD